jgi:hypothetical protein
LHCNVSICLTESNLIRPLIRYVVDAGRSKQKLLEAAGGLSKFEVGRACHADTSCALFMHRCTHRQTHCAYTNQNTHNLTHAQTNPPSTPK